LLSLPGGEGEIVPFVAIVCGLLLVGLGLDGYLDLFHLIRPEHTHTPTSLIPAYFGAGLIVCGLIALKASMLKHAMHLAAMIGLIGLVASAIRGLPQASRLFAGEPYSETFKPAAVKLQLWMAGICLVFVALCVNSFIQVRRRRRAAAAGGV
jgi:hypothetical protein